jgi:hypothetical protein
VSALESRSGGGLWFTDERIQHFSPPSWCIVLHCAQTLARPLCQTVSRQRATDPAVVVVFIVFIVSSSLIGSLHDPSIRKNHTFTPSRTPSNRKANPTQLKHRRSACLFSTRTMACSYQGKYQSNRAIKTFRRNVGQGWPMECRLLCRPHPTCSMPCEIFPWDGGALSLESLNGTASAVLSRAVAAWL